MSDNAPGWQADPTGKHDHRYWDGAQWTENVADAGVASIDPYEPTASEAAIDEAPTVTSTGPLFATDEPVPEEEPSAPEEPAASPESFAAQASYVTEEPVRTEEPVTDDAPFGLPYASDEPVDAEDTVVDQAPVDDSTDAYLAVPDGPDAWADDDAADGSPAPPPPYVPESDDGPGRFAALSNLGDGPKKGLLIGGGILVAILLAVVAPSIFGADDNPPTTPIGSSGSTETTGTTEPPKEGEYGSDPALDALHDACEDGDFAACDQLYLESPPGSGYQTFGDTCGGRNEPSGFCVKVYADDGADAAGEDDGLPDDFEATTAEEYATALGLEPEQAECLAGKFREAVEQGTLNEEDAMTGVVDFLSDCDISLEDFASN
jgi:hypothetical protein